MQPNHFWEQRTVWLSGFGNRKSPDMTILSKARIWLFIATLLLPLAFSQDVYAPNANKAEFSSGEKMKFPANYREWIYLTSGLDMTYGPIAATRDHSMFDNVFVNPEAYKSFLETGTWPDKTVLVLEIRGAESKGSINKDGHFQNDDVMGVEVHVKDVHRFPSKWAFYGFDKSGADASPIPTTANCYSCHQDHAAVDTTFVQFYPTLLNLAKEKKTLSENYLKETAPQGQPAK